MSHRIRAVSDEDGLRIECKETPSFDSCGLALMSRQIPFHVDCRSTTHISDPGVAIMFADGDDRAIGRFDLLFRERRLCRTRFGQVPGISYVLTQLKQSQER